MYIFSKEIENYLVMNKLEKLKLILEICKEHNITGYEIGKHTKISSFAAHKILMGETKNPNEATVDIILKFLEGAIKGTNIKEVNETAEPYQSKKIEDIIAEKVLEKLKPYLLNIEKALVANLIDIDDVLEGNGNRSSKNNKS